MSKSTENLLSDTSQFINNGLSNSSTPDVFNNCTSTTQIRKLPTEVKTKPEETVQISGKPPWRAE